MLGRAGTKTGHHFPSSGSVGLIASEGLFQFLLVYDCRQSSCPAGADVFSLFRCCEKGCYGSLWYLTNVAVL